MKALIHDGKIVDVAAQSFPVAPELSWVPCPADCRPETHEYVGGNIQVKPGPTQAELDAASNAQVVAKLASIDAASIRSIREWIAAQPTAPQILKDKENAAQAERAKLK